MKQTFSRARVGFLIFIGVVTFVVAVFLIGQKTQFFSRTFSVRVNFSNAEGVKRGTFVVMSGYTVGAVTDIQLTENADSVRLVLSVTESVRPFIKPDSRAEIKQEGLVGNKIVNLLIGSPEQKEIADGGYIQGVAPFALTGLADNITEITDTTKVISTELKNLLIRLNRGEGSLGRLLTEDAIYDNLRSITARTDTGLTLITSQLVRLSDILVRVTRSVDGVVLRSDTAVSSVGRITAQVEQLLINLNDGRGTAGALLTDRRAYDSLLTLLGALNDVAWDAGNAANQLAQSVYGLRTHWLLGRVFGGDDDTTQAPIPSYRKLMRELNARAADLSRREEELRAREQRLGIDGAKSGR